MSGAAVAVVEWVDPPILAGFWTPDIILAAGARPVGPGPGRPGARTTWDDLSDARPDLVIVSPCSFSIHRTIQELDANPELRARIRSLGPRLGAFVADEAYFSRPGPRLADGIELVRGLLRGDAARGPMPVAPLETHRAATREVGA